MTTNSRMLNRLLRELYSEIDRITWDECVSSTDPEVGRAWCMHPAYRIRAILTAYHKAIGQQSNTSGDEGQMNTIDINDLADQIEEQTKPPLQVGWHEVNETPYPMYWDGSEWRYAPGRVTASEPLTSAYFIGPASGAQS